MDKREDIQEEKRAEKRAMIQSWEDVFNKSAKTALGICNLVKFWDDDTSVLECATMLTKAAIQGLGNPDASLEKVVDSIIDSIEKNPSQKIEIKTLTQDELIEMMKENKATLVTQRPHTYGVFNLFSQKLVVSDLKTFDEAFKVAIDFCLENGYKKETIRVIKLMEF